jgi:Galactose oxidase, central domain
MALGPVRLFSIALLSGVLAACGGSGSPGGADTASPGGTTPTAIPSTSPAPVTATCPADTDPDAVGSANQARPQSGDASRAEAAFDRESGRVVHLQDNGETWTFDVCTNTWELVKTLGTNPPGGAELFYYPVDDLTYAVTPGTIRTFDVETSTWTTVAQPSGVLTVPGPPFAMDTVNGVIYGLDPGQQVMAYDIEGHTWAKVDQGEQLPPTDWAGAPMATYDPSAGVIVLYGLRPNEPAIAPQVEQSRSEAIAESWTFDPSAGVWKRVFIQNSNLSIFSGFYFLTGTEMAYNEASTSTVVIDSDGVSLFDANANRWSKAQTGVGWPSTTRVGHGLVDDAVNGRVIMFGGKVSDPQPDSGWQDGTDVWAYDVTTNTWTELVPPLSN